MIKHENKRKILYNTHIDIFTFIVVYYVYMQKRKGVYMKADEIINSLYEKDTSIAYKKLLELEELSKYSNSLYPYLDMFYEMIFHSSYVIRVRGFRLFCKQAKWDDKNQINEKLKSACCILHDEKPTAVRQALMALHDVAHYKTEMHTLIKEEISRIPYHIYKDTMQPLIQKDIQNLMNILSS